MARGFDFNFEETFEIGLGEITVDVHVKGYNPGYPAKIAGRPEDSYPAEGSDFDDIIIYLVTEKQVRKDGKNKVERIKTELPSEMYDVIVSAMGGDDYWYEKIDIEADEHQRSLYDEAMDRKYEEIRDSEINGERYHD